jgi:hypothetical protein
VLTFYTICCSVKFLDKEKNNSGVFLKIKVNKKKNIFWGYLFSEEENQDCTSQNLTDIDMVESSDVIISADGKG